MASIEAFGDVWDPKKKGDSVYPKLDNYYYKQLLSNTGLILQEPLTKDQDLKSIVEKFAQDQKAYHESFGKAFLKLVNLGHEAEELTNVENLLEDHPFKMFIDYHY